MRGCGQLPGEVVRTQSEKAVPAGVATWGWSRVSGASQRETGGLDSSALNREDASPGWREKLGVSLFPERGEKIEWPGYCVLGVHMLL